MRVDVSEIKTFRACKRQWQLSSRNRFHLRPLVTPPHFALGTLFHEALAMLYCDVSLEKVMDMVKREMKTDNDAALLAMVPGYYKNVLPGDLERFKVLDIEYKFSFVPTDRNGELLFDPVATETPGVFEHPINVCGSIDLVALDIEENAIYGFEHKTAKSFRDESYLWMDEQPRVYTEALRHYVEDYNARQHMSWLDAGAPADKEPMPVKLGGIYLNEVKKLLRQFQYQRTLCKYTEEDQDNFLQAFFSSCNSVKSFVENNSYAAPNPSYFACQMCTFKTICSTYMYENLDKEAVLEEFQEEFQERTEDHLEEKVERNIN